MKVLRVYVDTSVIGGCLDPEFETWSNGLMGDLRRGHYRPVLSDVTSAEIALAPAAVREIYAELLGLSPEVAKVGAEALALLTHYEARGVLGKRFRNDMLHIALATIAEADVLVSWNFRHIVRLDKIRLFNSVNLEQGYKTLPIYSPREVTTYGTQD